jgi:hypothetical protein
MSEITELLEQLKNLKGLKPDDLDQKQLLEIYNKEKVKHDNAFEHPLIGPTQCPSCGNYRLDFGGSVFECPQPWACKQSWDNKLQLKLCR